MKLEVRIIDEQLRITDLLRITTYTMYVLQSESRQKTY